MPPTLVLSPRRFVLTSRGERERERERGGSKPSVGTDDN